MDTMITRLLAAVSMRAEETGAKISDADLARAAKINQAAVKYWRDNPATQMKAENVFLLADYLKVDARWIATGEGEARKGLGTFPDANVTDPRLIGEITTLIIRLQMIRDEVEKIVKQASGLPDMLISGVHSHDVNIASIRRDAEATQKLIRDRQEGKEHGKQQRRRTKQTPASSGKN